VGYLCANFSLPIASLFSSYARCTRQTSDRQTDVRQKHRLMPPPYGGGGIIINSIFHRSCFCHVSFAYVHNVCVELFTTACYFRVVLLPVSATARSPVSPGVAAPNVHHLCSARIVTLVMSDILVAHFHLLLLCETFWCNIPIRMWLTAKIRSMPTWVSVPNWTAVFKPCEHTCTYGDPPEILGLSRHPSQGT